MSPAFDRLATVLIGKKLWQGWVVAAINSAVVCVIGVQTAQFGFVPANLLCIALYTSNLVNLAPQKAEPIILKMEAPPWVRRRLRINPISSDH